jgi:hypothetical protein
MVLGLSAPSAATVNFAGSRTLEAAAVVVACVAVASAVVVVWVAVEVVVAALAV